MLKSTFLNSVSNNYDVVSYRDINFSGESIIGLVGGVVLTDKLNRRPFRRVFDNFSLPGKMNQRESDL